MIRKALNEEENLEAMLKEKESLNQNQAAKKMMAQASKESFPETVESQSAAEEDSLILMINERVEEGIKLEDFASGQGIGRSRFVKDLLRPVSDSIIQLSNAEVQLIGLLTFMISLKKEQIFELQQTQTIGLELQDQSFMSMGTSFDWRSQKTHHLPFLSNAFLRSLDVTQKRLMNLAMFAFSYYVELIELDDPVENLLQQIQFELPVLFSKNDDEMQLEESVAELIEQELTLSKHDT